MAIYNSTVKQCVQRVPTIFKGKTVNYINSKYWKYTWISGDGNYNFTFPDPNKFSAFKVVFINEEHNPLILISPKLNTQYNLNQYDAVIFYKDHIEGDITELDTIGVL